MRFSRKAARIASPSTIGPRDVLMRIAVGFMSASSRAPTRLRVRGDRTVWMLMTSERRNSSSLSTRSAPWALARSGVRFSLQAITFMPMAVQTFATFVPRLPRPMMPSVRPSRSKPTVVCHPPPGRMALNSSRRCRAMASIRAMASSAVERPLPPP